MAERFPSIWRTNGVFWVFVWTLTLIGIGYLFWSLGGVAGLGVSWFPILMFVALGAVATAGSLVPALRVRRVLETFAEIVPGPTEVVPGGQQGLRWPDKQFEVCGAAAFLFILWHVKLRLPGEEWTFDTSAAPHVARYVEERHARASVTQDRLRPVPWSLSHWMPWGAALIVPALVAGAFDWFVRPGLFVPVLGFGAVVGIILLLYGRICTRRLTRRFVSGLQERGLKVDGPYVVEAGPAVRYVVFTDRGPVTLQVLQLGPLGSLNVHVARSFVQARPAHTDALLDVVVKE